jgi:NAD(P)-dependent dehydrogenase (short-subunit alcohol dehydrogenase family)
MRDFRAGAPREQARLKDRVALVTGASRGGGKGSALVLGEEGATVYVTGRSVRGGPTTLGRPGTIDDTAEELSARGGTGIAVRCDHTDDSQVEALFERIRGEQGRLDVLVNNAWSGYELPLYYETPFWEMEWRHWDLMFQGGLRATAFASTLAAPMMIEAGRGLIVNITWVLDRPHGVTFYEVVKNATNKLTEQMADDLRPHGVTCLAVSPGFMRLERMDLSPEAAAKAESPEFPGERSPRWPPTRTCSRSRAACHHSRPCSRVRLHRRRRQAAVGVLGRTLGGRLRRLAAIDHVASGHGSGDIPAPWPMGRSRRIPDRLSTGTPQVRRRCRDLY